MKKLMSGAVACALLCGCASTGAAPAELADGQGAVECRSVVVTGSNRKERICATAATWDEADEIRRQEAEEQVQRAKRQYNDVGRAIDADRGLSGS